MNTIQDIKMQMVDDNVGNQVRQNAVQNDGNKVGQNAVQNPSIQNVENMNGLSVVPEIANYNSYQIAQEDDARSNSHSRGMVDNVVPNKPVKTSVRVKRITVSQPNVIHKQQANSDSNGFSSTRVNNTAKTRIPHPRSNSNTDRVPSKSKSITANHDVCVLNYVNNMNSRADNQSANVTIRENQKKYKANAKNSKELGSKGSLASSRPSKPRTCLRWIPTGRIFAMCGKLTASSNTENKSEKSVCDNASTSNPSEPSSKGFPISTSLLGRFPTGKQLLVHDESRFKTSCSIDKDKYTMKA
ncbi:hypothetical protein Tco_0654586 [Tanacetum coccineum]|uniref:Uncharacterized protein n=1 Tax=Tanacetum coccineum TaxID=301880 RepID=A0ABQ4X3V3_9ASTR